MKDEMVGWQHRFNGHELEQTPGDGEGRKPLVLQSVGSRRVRHDLVAEEQQQHAAEGNSSRNVSEFQFSSVAQSLTTLCDPTDSIRPGLPVHHQLPELAPCPLNW